MKLTIQERIMALDILQNVTGNIVNLKIIRDMQMELSFSEAELKDGEIEFGHQGVTWNNSKAILKDVNLGFKALAILADTLKDLDAKQKLTINHISLYEKINGGN